MNQKKRVYPPGVCAIKPADLLGAMVTVQLEPILRGGAASVWFRPPASEKLGDAVPARGLCAGHHVPFLVIDDLELALAAGAEGVVLESTGTDVESVRRTLGDHALIGVNCGDDVERAIRSERAGADFVVLTEYNGGRIEAGLVADVKSRLTCPVVAGAESMSPEEAVELTRAGADVLAVSDVFSAESPKHATERLVQQIAEAGR